MDPTKEDKISLGRKLPNEALKKHLGDPKEKTRMD